MATLATHRWYLGGGSAQAFNNYKQIQTMSLKLNKQSITTNWWLD